MKKLILTVLSLLGFIFLAQAQVVETTTEGFLLPRKTTEERTMTANYPTTTAAGTQVFDTDTKSVWIWDGAKWKDLEVNAVPLWKTATEKGSDYYAANDIINYEGVLYKNLTGINADNSPDVNTLNWQIVSLSPEGGSGTATVSKRVGEMIFAKTDASKTAANGYLVVKPGTFIGAAAEYTVWASMYPEFVNGDDIVFPDDVEGMFLRNLGGDNTEDEGEFQTDLIKEHKHSTNTTYPIGGSSSNKIPYIQGKDWNTDNGTNVDGNGDKYPKVDGTTLEFQSSHLGHNHSVTYTGGDENRPINRAYQLYTIVDSY